MAFPALLAAGLQTAGSLAQTGINLYQQNKTNARNEAFAREMYDRERADSLSQWHMQNDYNSPQQQMARLKMAGLNPNLVYGSGASQSAAPMPSPSAPTFKAEAPQITGNPADSIFSYMDISMKQAQIDNLKVQNTVAEQEAVLKAAHTANVSQQTATSRFELDKATELRSTSMDMARETLRKLSADADMSISENSRRGIMQDQNLKESVERIMNMRAQRANTQADYHRILADKDRLLNSNKLLELDIRLRKLGISPSDPMYMRALGQALGTDDIFNELDKWTREKSGDFKSWFKNKFGN